MRPFMYNSLEEQTESEDEEIPTQEETDPTIETEITCQIINSITETARPVKIVSKKRKTQKKPKEKKEVRQVSKKINSTINLWCSRKMSPVSRTFQHWFVADTGAEVTLIPLSLVNRKNLLTTPDKKFNWIFIGFILQKIG